MPPYVPPSRAKPLFNNPLLERKRFRGKENKEGAMVASRMLQDAGLGET